MKEHIAVGQTILISANNCYLHIPCARECLAKHIDKLIASCNQDYEAL